jgi:hypothetical protein
MLRKLIYDVEMETLGDVPGDSAVEKDNRCCDFFFFFTPTFVRQ